ncbi:hypothetical protein FRB99_004674 [Tulasnella sp. 403]|nr:hypothetical protein FRB99_004674 [Tulasnella sp. 403]
MTGLEAIAPDLAHQFDDLSWRIECATFTEGTRLQDTREHPFEDPISRSDQLRREWEQVIEEICALDGFANVLQPTPFTTLKAAAAEGPVIFINVSELWSDAIIVTCQHPPTIIPLPDAKSKSVESLVDLFQKVVDHKFFIDARKLLWDLWEAIVKPIVLVLEQMPSIVKGSRIWWCPSSAVMTLSLHAAGNYGSKGRHLPDLYISLYIPTLSALSHVRQGQLQHSGPSKFLLVSQPNTPGMSSLPRYQRKLHRSRSRLVMQQ